MPLLNRYLHQTIMVSLEQSFKQFNNSHIGISGVRTNQSDYNLGPKETDMYICSSYPECSY